MRQPVPYAYSYCWLDEKLERHELIINRGEAAPDFEPVTVPNVRVTCGEKYGVFDIKMGHAA